MAIFRETMNEVLDEIFDDALTSKELQQRESRYMNILVRARSALRRAYERVPNRHETLLSDVIASLYESASAADLMSMDLDALQGLPGGQQFQVGSL